MIASGVILAENIVLPKYSHVISRDVSTKESTSNKHTIVDPNAGTLHEGKARFYFGRFLSLIKVVLCVCVLIVCVLSVCLVCTPRKYALHI